MNIDLQSFCGDGCAHPLIQKPFSCGAFTYATDGVVIIRVHRRDDVPDGGPGLERVLPEIEAALQTRAFGPIPEFETKLGKLADRACFATHDFDRKYVDLIAALPSVAVAFSDIKAKHPTDTRAALVFRFDGGSGALMPMTRAYTKDAA
jgi:hypothetical protein